MASTIAISCPKCEKAIKAPAELAGKKIRCKECQHVFTIPGAAAKAGDKAAKPAKAAKAAKPAKGSPLVGAGAVEDADTDPYDVTDHSFLPRCPYCAKELDSEDQVVCRNCGYNRRTRERIKTEKTLAPTAGEWIVHLLPGILCAIWVLLTLAGLAFTWINREEHMIDYAKANGGDPTINPYSQGVALWESVISLGIAFFAARFAVKRLILHPRPPEKEMKATKK
jgi:hypothetical protein